MQQGLPIRDVSIFEDRCPRFCHEDLRRLLPLHPALRRGLRVVSALLFRANHPRSTSVLKRSLVFFFSFCTSRIAGAFLQRARTLPDFLSCGAAPLAAFVV